MSSHDNGKSPGKPYRESVELRWTEIAFEMLDHGDLGGEVISSGGVIRSRIWGPCPQCGHHLDDYQTHTAVTSFYADGWRGTTRETGDPAAATDEPPYFQVDVSCGCGNTHSGAPEGKTGCGVSFRVELLLQPEGGGDQR
jgi:hypothetical protein